MRLPTAIWAVITAALFAWFVWTMLEIVAALAIFALQMLLAFFVLSPQRIGGNRSQRRAYRRMAFYGGTEKQVLMNIMYSRDPTISDTDKEWAERLLIRRGYIVYIPRRNRASLWSRDGQSGHLEATRSGQRNCHIRSRRTTDTPTPAGE